MLERIEQTFQKYLEEPDETSKGLRIAHSGTLVIVEQNKSNNSTLASLANTMQVANIIYDDRYYGFIFNKNIYLNERYFVSESSFQTEQQFYNTIRKIWKQHDKETTILGGIKIEYVKFNTGPSIVYWKGSREHLAVNTNIIDTVIENIIPLTAV